MDKESLREKLEDFTQKRRINTPDGWELVETVTLDGALEVFGTFMHEKGLKDFNRGRRVECDGLRRIAQNDDRLTPDEYEAILLVLNDRLRELSIPK